MTNGSTDTRPGGYPKNVENPDEWAAFLARYLDNRVTNGVHNGIGLVALHIVDAIKDARAPMPTETSDLPWGMVAYNAIQAALYQLENEHLPDEAARKRRAMEILREVDAPTPGDAAAMNDRPDPDDNRLDLSTVPDGWEFVNLFNHVREGAFYCRIRQSMSGDPSAPEVTCHGRTPARALAAAVSKATYDNAAH